MNIAQSFLAYINSFATETYATKHTVAHGTYAPVVPVSLINLDTQKAVPVAGGMLVDTGADDTVLNDKYVKLIGLDNLKKGIPFSISGAAGGIGGIFYMHRVPLKIGNLRPVNVNVLFGPKLEEDQVLGRTTLREYITTLTLQHIKISEYQQAAAQSAYVKALHAVNTNSGYRYRNRI